jgi:hypothetical protein
MYLYTYSTWGDEIIKKALEISWGCPFKYL